MAVVLVAFTPARRRILLHNARAANGPPRIGRSAQTTTLIISLLKSLLRGAPKGRGDAQAQLAAMHPLAARQRLKSVHAAAPLDAHLDILFANLRFAAGPALALVDRAIKESNTLIPPLKAVHRRASALNLAQYFLHARALGGQAAECGVFTGCSALTCCLAARAVDPSYDGTGFHLIDSFAGLSEPGEDDQIAVVPELGVGFVPPEIPPGNYAAPLQYAQHSMKPFPGVAIHEGWIPAVFAELPDTGWAYVHVDVDLYAPTLASLEYFFPRLVPRGVLICDDYGAPTFPGARRAWDAYCDRQGLPFVVLPTGQAVLMKAG